MKNLEKKLQGLLVRIFLMMFVACSTAGAAQGSGEENRSTAAPIVFFDATGLFKLDLKDERQLRRFWDETHLIVTLQGLANRERPRLFIRYLKQPDDFWWNEMTGTNGWLRGREVVRIASLDQLLKHFRGVFKGVVVWDERVPSTSNLASSIAGCDELLALRYDPTEGSLYRQLTSGANALSVKVRLLREDGGSLFTGTGTVPGTGMPSSGSAKCDAYLWLIEHYLKTGKANPRSMGYYIDSYWLKCWHAAAPENHTLSNHDYVIAHRGLLFDLNVWDDEACVDDPKQKPGTDVATLKRLFRAAYDRFQGDGVIHVAGFTPWAYKYTTHRSQNWSAGGKYEGVPTEWRYAEILSCYNAYMDADALGLGAMANASFFQHYPLAARYPQNPKPSKASLMKQGILDVSGRILPHVYVAHYVGDYDAAAWLYRMLPEMWGDPARGTVPLSWAFNPNLCERFPLGMAWARERRTTNDWFVAGDSGAGYLNPGYLTPPRVHSGLPSGLAAWEKHCEPLYKQWDITLTGFVIDGYARGLSPEGVDAYARFSPDGIVAQKIGTQGVHKGMPYIRMNRDLDGSPAEVARGIGELAVGSTPKFVVCRSILKRPTWYAEIQRELRKTAGGKLQFVDLYTLLWLVREYETNPSAHPVSPYANAPELVVTPGRPAGLVPLTLADGEFRVVEHSGARCWRVAKEGASRYFYVDVDDGFRFGRGAWLEIELEYLNAGTADVLLEYDSSDTRAPLGGSYKAHPNRIRRSNSGQWVTARFQVSDARFRGSQNGGADFRFFNGKDELLVRSVRVRRVGP